MLPLTLLKNGFPVNCVPVNNGHYRAHYTCSYLRAFLIIAGVISSFALTNSITFCCNRGGSVIFSNCKFNIIRSNSAELTANSFIIYILQCFSITHVSILHSLYYNIIQFIIKKKLLKYTNSTPSGSLLVIRLLHHFFPRVLLSPFIDKLQIPK